MDEKLSHADIQQLYDKNLMIHKGVLVKVGGFEFDRPVSCSLLNVSTGKKTRVEFKQEDFKAPEKRIGFVNHKQAVVYVVRNPVRRYGLGINTENSECRLLPSKYYPLDRSITRDKVRTLEVVDVYKAYANKYPTMKEAIENAVAWKGACAFDKQFAVTYDMQVYYKDLPVGEIVDDVLKFKNEYSYLEIVLESNYEKNSGTFKATCL